MNIGLTGGIACGKSTVADMLVRRGAVLIDADRIAREVVEPGEPALLEIAGLFGQAMLNGNGSLNRKALGAVVFADTDKRKQLEAILHPRIRQKLMERMESSELASPDRLVVVDVPLLFESHMQSLFQEIMLVYVPADVQLNRLMTRDKLSKEEAGLRLAAQWPIDDKKNQADVVIDNSGDTARTEQQINHYWRTKGLS